MDRSVLVALLVGLGACDGDAVSLAEDFPRACSEPGACTVYSGVGWTESDVVDNCSDGDVVDDCPTGALGECTIDPDTDFSTLSRLYPGRYTEQGARQQCEAQFGTWTSI